MTGGGGSLGVACKICKSNRGETLPGEHVERGKAGCELGGWLRA